jgi:polyhydroxyalkanoate synthesis regulator phasin
VRGDLFVFRLFAKFSESTFFILRKEDLAMFDALRKAVLFGTGLAVMTTEKMKDFAEELVKRGEMSEKEAKEALKEWMEKSKKARKDMEEKTESTVNNVLNRMNIPSRSELDELKERLAKLEQIKNSKETA